MRALKFVAYDRIEDHLRLGWMVAIPNGPTHHEHYGIVLQWMCDCQIPRFAVAIP